MAFLCDVHEVLKRALLEAYPTLMASYWDEPTQTYVFEDSEVEIDVTIAVRSPAQSEERRVAKGFYK